MKLVGRSSSHFTRVVRMFAHELEVSLVFSPLADLSSRAPNDYAGNPALKIPILETADGPWFGALNICRELARRAPIAPNVLWPEMLLDRQAANAQELVHQGMATEVALIMQASAAPGGAIATSSKAFDSLTNSLVWLDAHLPTLRGLVAPNGTLSFFALTLFCFVTHLEFRQVADVSAYSALQAFCNEYARRPSAQATAFRYDFSSP